MAITASDLKFRLSAPAASAGDELSQTTPAASLGGHPSKTVWAGGTLHDLFGQVTGDQNAARTVDYRCIFVVNLHGTLSWTSVVAWLSATVAGGTEVAIGVDPTAASLLDASTAQARTVLTTTEAPQGVT